MLWLRVENRCLDKYNNARDLVVINISSKKTAAMFYYFLSMVRRMFIISTVRIIVNHTARTAPRWSAGCVFALCDSWVFTTYGGGRVWVPAHFSLVIITEFNLLLFTPHLNSLNFSSILTCNQGIVLVRIYLALWKN